MLSEPFHATSALSKVGWLERASGRIPQQSPKALQYTSIFAGENWPTSPRKPSSGSTILAWRWGSHEFWNVFLLLLACVVEVVSGEMQGSRESSPLTTPPATPTGTPLSGKRSNSSSSRRRRKRCLDDFAWSKLFRETRGEIFDP